MQPAQHQSDSLCAVRVSVFECHTVSYINSTPYKQTTEHLLIKLPALVFIQISIIYHNDMRVRQTTTNLVSNYTGRVSFLKQAVLAFVDQKSKSHAILRFPFEALCRSQTMRNDTSMFSHLHSLALH